ncbi:LuxR C-terminal-related transcriptional regulator [Peristeroidobacter soli]|uniref:LuxR C-terminal-related transcriptional regulator n=1 Tax=Peristeroidobacter soli TaxID=2497877 RepID=UPI0013008F65|nr:response regulator transcription factor [Peristeroidobacter soli]
MMDGTDNSSTVARDPPTESTGSERILLVEDDELIKVGLTVGLRENVGSRFEFVTIESVEAALTVTDARMGLILIDVRLSGSVNGGPCENIDCLRQRFPEVPLGLLSVGNSPRLLCDALERGAAGVIPRRTPLSIVAIAIELMIAGGVYLPPQFATLLNGRAAAGEPESTAKRSPGELTGRQQAILDLLAGGASNKEIAIRLQLSVGTVKNYVSGLLRMMQMPTRNRLVAHLRQRVGGAPAQQWSSNRAELLRGWMSDAGSRHASVEIPSR